MAAGTGQFGQMGLTGRLGRAWTGLDRTWTTGWSEHYMEDRTAGTGQTRLETVARLPRQNSGAGHRGHLVCLVSFDGQKEQNDQKMTTRT
jgi:hypothetical protein